MADIPPNLFVYFSLLLLLSDGPLVSDAFIRRPNSAGLMKLCPPGGESFAAAWEITCGMRRKKRSLQSDRMEEEEGKSGENGQKKDHLAVSSLLDNPLTVEGLSAEDIAKLAKRSSMLLKNMSKLVGGKKQKANEYRAPSMTEMMLFCCRFGCSLRDLMPYCDPFGQWDS